MKKAFLWIALLEGISYVALLLVAMPLKYLAGIPEAVSYVGAVHGFLFVMYIIAAFYLGMQLQWTAWRTLKVMAMSLLPWGPFMVRHKLKS